MSYLKTTFLFLLLATNCFSQDTSLSEINRLTQKAAKYLLKDKSLSTYYSISANGISIYETPENKISNKPEFHVALHQLDDFKMYLENSGSKELMEMYKTGNFQNHIQKVIVAEGNSGPINEKKLQGKKIAIDPGHIAGNMEMGDIEKKCLTFKCTGPDGVVDSIVIAEGMLTLATAQLLKEKLEKEGAEVFMTRTFSNGSAFGVTLDDWLKTDYTKTVDSLCKVGKISLSQKQFFSGTKPTKRDKFRVIFKDVELAKRAEIINNYKPDLTVVIHYNVDETNTGWVKPANKNFNMTFVGGAFMKNDLSTPEKRFEFLRMLVTDDVENSIALSSAVVKSFEKNLNVKTATVKDAEYLSEGCLTAAPGVYCRNLQLTRYIHGPLVYGETLYQDNVNECILLNKETDKTKNPRVQQVAEAYFQGIMSYVLASGPNGN
jgi:N-acetylmuramoyl-L-alanine amidase